MKPLQQYFHVLLLLFRRRPNRVIEMACFDQSCNRHAIHANLEKPSKQAKRRECLLSNVSRHSIYPRYVRPTDNARLTNLQ